MASRNRNRTSVCISILYLLFQFLSVKSDEPLVPALYVFGDSLMDSGNNDYLDTQAKVDYMPYGIDFPLGATGRFTNGKTSVDFFAELLGLPYVPPYLGLLKGGWSNTTTGINYASGSAGILRKTGTASGENLCLGEQIKYFHSTLRKDLKKGFETRTKLTTYLAKSIFVINIGSNDYINNYLQPASFNSSKIYNPEQFAKLLVHHLKKGLAKLHKFGARKFVVFALGPIGCLPAIVNSANPRPNTPCIEAVNNYALMYNRLLPQMIECLNSTLQHSTFVLGDIYALSYDANINPTKYGFTDGTTPCCVVGGNGTTICLPNQTPCRDRNTHFYFDAFHPTQVVNNDLAIPCFNGSSPCIPINIQQLAQK